MLRPEDCNLLPLSRDCVRSAFQLQIRQQIPVTKHAQQSSLLHDVYRTNRPTKAWLYNSPPIELHSNVGGCLLRRQRPSCELVDQSILQPDQPMLSFVKICVSVWRPKTRATSR